MQSSIRVVLITLSIVVCVLGGITGPRQLCAGETSQSLGPWLADAELWRIAGSQYRWIQLDWPLQEPAAAQIMYDFGQRPGTSGVYMQLREPQELQGYPRSLGLWLYGDGSGHWLRGEVQDAAGVRYPVDYTAGFPNGVTWKGWRYVEAALPQGLAEPLSLTAPLRLMALDGTDKGRGILYVGDILLNYTATPPSDMTQPQWQPPDPGVVWEQNADAAGHSGEVRELQPVGTVQPERITLTWASDPTTTQAVTWWTHPSVTQGKARVVPAIPGSDPQWDSSAVVTAAAATTVLQDEDIQAAVHAAVLTDLQPGTAYVLQVGDGSATGWSQPHPFRTLAAEAESVSFLYAADTHVNGDAAIWQDILEQGLQQYPAVDFVVHGGDMVDQGFSLQRWRSFLDRGQGVTSRLPLLAAVGNHDVYGQGRQWFTVIFPYPQHGPSELLGTVYTLGLGPLRLVMLDTEVNQRLRQLQMRWLEEQLDQMAEFWTVVVFHRAPYSSNPLRGPDGVREAFAPTLERLGVDLVLTAHDHVYMRTHPLQGGVPAAAGTVYVTGGAAGSKFYPGQSHGYTKVLFAEDTPVYTAVTVTQQELSLEARTLDGRLLDRWEVQR